MIPTRQKLIGGDKVEKWNTDWGKWVHVNDKLVAETYDQAVARLEREALDKRRQV
ncbi:hypothetical protein LCGC14_2769740 [marine sediment metagenome]|uniref:Uncharacterized protein n=1 Tax=marine sediment metagenome TaxID=412755 RepID=A0A0F9B5B1_9ZZZZ